MNALTIDVLNAADPAQAASSLPTAQALSVFRDAIDNIFEIEWHHQGWRSALRSTIGALASRELPFDANDFERAISVINGHVEMPAPVLEKLVALVEHWVAAHSLDDAQRRVVEAVLRGGVNQAIKTRIRVLTTVGAAGPQPGANWAEQALAEIGEMSDAARAAWQALFAHGAGIEGARPSQKWQREAKTRVAAIDAAGDDFAARLVAWMARVEKPKELVTIEWQYAPPFSEGNTDALKTLCWAAGAAGVGSAAIGDLAALCFTKIPGYGPVSTRVGNAALFALGAQPSFDGVAQLSRLKLRVKYASAQRLIGRALDAAAQRSGLGVDDLEEMAVPSFGLDADGRACEIVAGWRVELDTKNGMTTVIFRSPDGKKTPKTAPKEIKADAAWKPLKARIAEIEKRLPIERERIERLYWTERVLPFDAFEARYLRHPLVGTLARRLLWTAGGEPGLWRDGALRSLGGDALSGEVSLWHPLGFNREELQVWRDLLESEGVMQPFKQAHRETYAPLDTESEFTASNRFAGHVLRQHQLAALFSARGWRYRLQGGFDSYNTPALTLPRHGLTVELEVEGAGDLAGSAIYLHVVTGNLRFSKDDEPVRLGEVPPLIYSEVLRDVDLFISVCSIGIHPRRETTFDEYWARFSVGELSASAQTRRDVIAHLLPRLPEANRLSIDSDGRFLRVRGQRADYRIHLGSGQVVVEPDQRVIYVSKAAAALPAGIQLPFEGDELAVGIVGKAMLLAADKDVEGHNA
jgi:hypothetical protein